MRGGSFAQSALRYIIMPERGTRVEQWMAASLGWSTADAAPSAWRA